MCPNVLQYFSSFPAQHCRAAIPAFSLLQFLCASPLPASPMQSKQCQRWEEMLLPNCICNGITSPWKIWSPHCTSDPGTAGGALPCSCIPLEWGNSNTDRPELKATEISAPSDQHAMLLSVPATAAPRLCYPCTVPSMDGQDCWQSSLILIKGLLTVLENHRLEAEPVFAPWVEPRLKQQNQSTANKCDQRKKKENQQQWLWNSLFSSFLNI